MSISSKIESLITAANSVTGESRTDLTSAVQDLKDGYGGGGLPSEYEAVEYIESTGTQYIITDYVPNIYSNVNVKYRLREIPSVDYFDLFGVNVGGLQPPAFYMTFEKPDSNRLKFRQYWTNNNCYIQSGDTGYSINEDHIASFGGMKNVFVDGAVARNENSNFLSFTNSQKLFIFALNVNNTAMHTGGRWRVYYFKVINIANGNLELNLVPCKRKADDEAGLYDLVNGVFYTNQGTGDFVVPT